MIRIIITSAYTLLAALRLQTYPLIRLFIPLNPAPDILRSIRTSRNASMTNPSALRPFMSPTAYNNRAPQLPSSLNQLILHEKLLIGGVVLCDRVR
jgi:hypothetical protein